MHNADINTLNGICLSNVIPQIPSGSAATPALHLALYRQPFQTIPSIKNLFPSLPRREPASFLRKQVFQIRLGETARKALFPEHVGNRLGFALLELPNFLLHGSRRDQAVGVDGLGLTDPV